MTHELFPSGLIQNPHGASALHTIANSLIDSIGTQVNATLKARSL
jgi:hypothetical protein